MTTELHYQGPRLAWGFLAYKRRKRAQFSAAFALLAVGSIAAFSWSFEALIPISSDGQIRTIEQRRVILLQKLPWAIASFAMAAPLGAIAVRIKRLSEDSHDLREEERIGARQWQAAYYAPPPPRELQTIELPPPPPAPPEELNLNILLNASLLLVYGGQGSGKTTFARALGFIRQTIGHTVKVADPHGAPQRWAPWPVLGSGRKYGEVEQALHDFDRTVTSRYEAYSNGVDDFPRETIICDELTQWSAHVPAAAGFIASACSDIRKINLHVLLVSHADTIAGLGGAKGFRESFDGNAVKLFLESTLNPADGEYYPTGYGVIFIPGQPERRVKVPDMRQYIVQGLPAFQPAPAGQALPPGPSMAIASAAAAPAHDLPAVCVDFLNWLAENRASAEEGCIKKRLIQQQFKPHQKGMPAETFDKVLRRLQAMGYVEYLEDSPARVRLLKLSE